MDDFFNFGVQALFAGGSAPYSSSFEGLATRTIQGVQSANISVTFPRSDEFGWDGGGNQEIVERPRAELGFSYFFASGLNERNIGLVISQSVPALAGLNVERNYYLVANQAHQDQNSYRGWDNKVLALGNGVLTNYSFSAGVGQMSTVSASVQGLNLLIQGTGSGQVLPSILKQDGSQWTGTYTVPFATGSIGNFADAAPGNIILSFNTGSALGTALSGNVACPLQSFKFNIDIPRGNIKDLGWAYPSNRPVQWPVTIGISADAYLNNLQADALNRFNCADSGHDFSVGFHNACGATDDIQFRFLGAKLESQSFSAQVGALNRVSFNWSMKIMDINRTYPNFYAFSSGTAYTGIFFPQVDYTAALSPLEIDFGTSAYIDVLSGPTIMTANSAYVSDAAETSVIRITETGTAQYYDITITVS